MEMRSVRATTSWIYGCVLSVFAIHVSDAIASGFRIPELSIAGLGTSNALVADPREPGAIAYNPAAMSFHDGNTLVAGMLLIDPNLSVWAAGGANVDSRNSSPVIVPNLSFATKIDPAWALGINVNAPFGLETNWPDETFPAFAGPLDPLEPAKSKVELINVNPNVAWRAGPDTSLALGVDYYFVRDTVLNTHGIDVHGDGSDLGWNLGVMHVAGPWSVGLSYRSSVKIDIEGTVDARALSPALTPSGARTEVELPDMLQLGLRYEVNPALAVEFDYERTGWSSFDEISIAHSTAGLPNPIRSVNDWEDANAYRLGATWRVTDVTRLRFGYTLDQTPQRLAHFSARIPDADRQLFSVGVAHDLGAWTLEGGYMYVRFRDRSVNNSAPFAGGDANGTAAYNGTYEADVHLLGVGITTSF